MAKAAKCDVCGKLYEPYGFRICFNDGCGEHDIRVRCEEFDPSYDDHLNTPCFEIRLWLAPSA